MKKTTKKKQPGRSNLDATMRHIRALRASIARLDARVDRVELAILALDRRTTP